tara:strand:+ start:299 stop:526 length:228 start_codon:yes stop_codon:yes gene_type:complete
MPYFIKWTLSLLLAGLYWYVGLSFLSAVLVRLSVVDGSLIESENIIIYIITWVIAVPLAFKSTNTQFFFGAKKGN